MKVCRVVLLLICITLIACCLTGCFSKTAQTEADFGKIMREAGFEIKVMTGNSNSNGMANNYAKSILVAENDNYEIEFYCFKGAETAKSVFDNCRSQFDNQHPTNRATSKVNQGNYNYYAITADGEFHMISRVDDTILRCEADKEYKKEIIGYAKELGYK